MSEDHMQLQEDVLTEILARLPVKSLIRFICVCKYWQSLITSPEFASKHYTTRLRILRNENHNDPYDSLLTTLEFCCSISVLSYEDLSYKTAFKFRPSVYVPKPLRFGACHCHVISDWSIYGPCKGLFLVVLMKANKYVLLIWNPATRKVFKVPNNIDGIGHCNGFGFDSKTNDYKIVSFHGTSEKTSVVLVYSLNANAWRQVDAGYRFGEGDKIMESSTSTTNNGGMHHWTICDVKDMSNSLISFDMVDEVFVETPIPMSSHIILMRNESNNMYPLVYDLDTRNSPTGIIIWALKEYGPRGTWIKQQYIALPERVTRCTSSFLLWKNEGVIFAGLTSDHDQIGLALYNLTTQEVKSLKVPSDITGFTSYTESLFSVTNFVHREQPPSPFVYQAEEEADYSTLGIADQVVDADDDDDSSSTDSAFMMPEEAHKGPNDFYVDYDEDIDSFFRKKNEVERLSKLPYCVHEVNQPLVSNPCTF